MPILYMCIARGTKVLTQYASCTGNFAQVTELLLAKIPPHDDKLTYLHANYLFHYIASNKIIYLCITDAEFERSRAFLYLNEMKRRYLAQQNPVNMDQIGPDFVQVMSSEMKHYSESRDLDTISRVHGELDELKNIMVKNVENVAERGERLELLVNKADNLNADSVTFRKTSRNLARSMFWINFKIYLILGGITLFVIYFIISMACGGFLWGNCRSSDTPNTPTPAPPTP